VVLTPAGPDSTCVTFDIRSRTRGRAMLTAPLLAPFLRWIAASIDNARGVLEAGRGRQMTVR
jgi:hypothetical protein